MFNLSQLSHFPPVLKYDVEEKDLENDWAFKNIVLDTRFVFETLCHAKESETYGAWIKQLKSLYQNHIPACKWFLGNFLAQGTLLKELVLECSVERIRIGLAELVGHILKTLSPYEHSFFMEREIAKQQVKVKTRDGREELEMRDVLRCTAIVPRFMDQLLDLLEDSRNYWRKFKQYFLIIRDFALLGSHERRFLLDRELISLYTGDYTGFFFC